MYMVVTDDKLELPICFGTCKEVAKFLNIKEINVYHSSYRKIKKSNRGYKIIRVKFSKEEIKDVESDLEKDTPYIVIDILERIKTEINKRQEIEYYINKSNEVVKLYEKGIDFKSAIFKVKNNRE